MIRLRHFLHPVRSSKSLYRRGKLAYEKSKVAYYKMLSDRAAMKLPRLRVSHCWCGGGLEALAFTKDYAACKECGCYVNVRPPQPECLKEFYSIDGYWRTLQKARGVPPIEERADLYRRDGRLAHWLDVIQRYAPRPCAAVEVGCAPGVLLSELARRGYVCTGVEPDPSTVDWIRRNVGVSVIEGMFPGTTLPKCNLFLSFDVAEHTPAPLAFWSEISRVLNPGGVAVLQTPIECRDYQNPFKDRRQYFDGVEHLYLYTDRSVQKLTALADLELVALEDEINTWDQICVLRKPPRGS